MPTKRRLSEALSPKRQSLQPGAQITSNPNISHALKMGQRITNARQAVQAYLRRMAHNEALAASPLQNLSQLVASVVTSMEGVEILAEGAVPHNALAVPTKSHRANSTLQAPNSENAGHSQLQSTQSRDSNSDVVAQTSYEEQTRMQQEQQQSAPHSKKGRRGAGAVPEAVAAHPG